MGLFRGNSEIRRKAAGLLVVACLLWCRPGHGLVDAICYFGFRTLGMDHAKAAVQKAGRGEKLHPVERLLAVWRSYEAHRATYRSKPEHRALLGALFHPETELKPNPEKPFSEAFKKSHAELRQLAGRYGLGVAGGRALEKMYLATLIGLPLSSAIGSLLPTGDTDEASVVAIGEDEFELWEWDGHTTLRVGDKMYDYYPGHGTRMVPVRNFFANQGYWAPSQGIRIVRFKVTREEVAKLKESSDKDVSFLTPAAPGSTCSMSANCAIAKHTSAGIPPLWDYTPQTQIAWLRAQHALGLGHVESIRYLPPKIAREDGVKETRSDDRGNHSVRSLQHGLLQDIFLFESGAASVWSRFRESPADRGGSKDEAWKKGLRPGGRIPVGN